MGIEDSNSVVGALEVLRPPDQAMSAAPEMIERAKAQVSAWFEMRAYVLNKIQEILVPGVDYTEIEVYDKKAGKKVKKRSLGKAGAEKLAALPMFEFRPTFIWDEETSAAALAAGAKGWLCYWCDLHKPDGTFVGRGGGARNIDTDGGDLNKTRKMAQKSAYIDAVIRACGISDVVTQDMEKVAVVPSPKQPEPEQPPEPIKQPEPPRQQPVQEKFVRGFDDPKPKPKQTGGWIPDPEWMRYLDEIMPLAGDRVKDKQGKVIDPRKVSEMLCSPKHRNPAMWYQITQKFMKALGPDCPEAPACVKSAAINSLEDE